MATSSLRPMASATLRAPLAFLYPPSCGPLLTRRPLSARSLLRPSPHTASPSRLAISNVSIASAASASAGLASAPKHAFHLSRRTYAAKRVVERQEKIRNRYDNNTHSKLKSTRVSAVEQARKDPFNDFGLTTGTFIMPTGSGKPSWLEWPKARLKLEWHRIKVRATDLTRMVFIKYGAKIKPIPKLRKWRLPKIAQALHRNMYTAYADRDVRTLNEICCMGLRDKFLQRLDARKPGEFPRWVLHNYNGSVTTVSDRATGLQYPGLPVDQMVILRQAVVRIASTQSLEPGMGLVRSGEVHPDSKQDLVEYVVIQQLFGLGEEAEKWKVWGTTEEDPDFWKMFI